MKSKTRTNFCGTRCDCWFNYMSCLDVKLYILKIICVFALFYLEYRYYGFCFWNIHLVLILTKVEFYCLR